MAAASEGGRAGPAAPLAGGVARTPDTRVVRSEDGRGHATLAARGFRAGEQIFCEPPLVLVYPTRDPEWLATLRGELLPLSEACAWQYCVACRCLLASELPPGAPEGLAPMEEEQRRKLMDLCGREEQDGEDGASDLAELAAGHLLGQAAGPACGGGGSSGSRAERSRLASLLDDLAARVSRNGFQVVDLKARPATSADGLFHRISFLNHCCAGLNNASWTYDGAEGLLTLKATRDVADGEELTISYISKPWCDMARPARRQYLKQNFNFVCLCRACTEPARAAPGAGAAAGAKGGLAQMLVRWMQEERPEAAEEPEGAGAAPDGAEPAAAAATGAEGAGASAGHQPGEPRRPRGEAVDDEERLRRLLERCAREGLGAGPEQAAAALAAEGGHVGKAMIKLRREGRPELGAPPEAAAEPPPPAPSAAPAGPEELGAPPEAAAEPPPPAAAPPAG